MNKNWRTTLGQIMTAIGLIPAALDNLELTTMPNWLVMVGVGSAFITFIWTGLQTKDKNVTGGTIEQ